MHRNLDGFSKVSRNCKIQIGKNLEVVKLICFRNNEGDEK